MILKRLFSTTTTATKGVVSTLNKIMNNSNKEKVLIISGGTGIGKSDLSLKIAKQINGEIIGADSVQIYKYVTIGSNKIMDNEGVPHHLIDILELNDVNFCAFDYFALVKKTIQDIINRGKTPIIVGGSGFYLDSILKGARTELSNDKERDEIKELYNKMKLEDNWDYYYNLLKEKDIDSANIILRNDYMRLSKSLYFNTVKGIKFSTQKNEYQDSIADTYDFRTFYLSCERVKVHSVLNTRCENMLCSGLLDEVYNLLKDHKDFKSSKASESIGYREIVELLLKPINNNNKNNKNNSSVNSNNSEVVINDDNIDPITRKEVISNILDFQTSTRNYYRRQASWFKKEKNFEWINSENKDIDKYIIETLNNSYENWEKNRDLKKEEELKTLTKDTKFISGYKPNEKVVDFVYKEANKFRNNLIKSNPELYK